MSVSSVPPQVLSNVSFLDYDLDETELGGNLTWVEREDVSQATGGSFVLFMEQVERYNVYFARPC